MAAAARMHFAVNELNAAIAAATTLAAAWRGEAARVQLEVQHTAATTMQAAARRHIAVRDLAPAVAAAMPLAAASLYNFEARKSAPSLGRRAAPTSLGQRAAPQALGANSSVNSNAIEVLVGVGPAAVWVSLAKLSSLVAVLQ